ncbi:MAG: hypothetical protein ABI541_12715 [Betaproteobacteria bacterium]
MSVSEPAELGFEVLLLPELLDDLAKTFGADSDGVPLDIFAAFLPYADDTHMTVRLRRRLARPAPAS